MWVPDSPSAPEPPFSPRMSLSLATVTPAVTPLAMAEAIVTLDVAEATVTLAVAGATIAPGCGQSPETGFGSERLLFKTEGKCQRFR